MKKAILPLLLILSSGSLALADSLPSANQYGSLLRELRHHAREVGQLTESAFQVTEDASFSGEDELYYVEAADLEIQAVARIANELALIAPEGAESSVLPILEETRKLTAAREELQKFLLNNKGQSPSIGCQSSLIEIQIAADRLAEPARVQRQTASIR